MPKPPPRSPKTSKAPPDTPQRRLNVVLTLDGAKAMEELRTRTELQKVDLANRSLRYYNHADKAMRDGAEVVFRYPDGTSEVVKFL